MTSDPLEQDAFDLVHARAVLEHLPARDEVIGRLVSALRPGGVLVLEDFVFGGPATDAVEAAVGPEANGPVLTRVLQAISSAFRAIGADSLYGLQLPAALSAAGLGRWTPNSPSGSFARQPAVGVLLPDLQRTRRAAGRAGPAHTPDVDQSMAFVDDPTSRWLSLGVVTSWGRRP